LEYIKEYLNARTVPQIVYFKGADESIAPRHVGGYQELWKELDDIFKGPTDTIEKDAPNDIFKGPTDTIEKDAPTKPNKALTGLSTDYYKVSINNPTTPLVEPYSAECNDVIEALDMTYAEANVFKAIWRKSAQRTLGLSKGGNTQVYDAEKCVFFSSRILEIDMNRM
jgi:hypothetical protein